MRLLRLKPGDRELARALFSTMAAVFGDSPQRLSDEYLDRLLARDDFWAIVALSGDRIIGGVTAHTLPMTRAEVSEIFIYDVAVRPEEQRKGIGRQLLDELRERATAAGTTTVFVFADNDDVHALDFYRALGGEESSVTSFTFSSRTGGS